MNYLKNIKFEVSNFDGRLDPQCLRLLSNESRALLLVVWNIRRAVSSLCCHEAGGTSGTILVKRWEVNGLEEGRTLSDMGWNESQVKLEVPFTFFSGLTTRQIERELALLLSTLKSLMNLWLGVMNLSKSLPWWYSLGLDLAFVMTCVENSWHEVFVILSTPTR